MKVYNREQTDLLSNIPDDQRKTGLRPLSIASITLMTMIDNKVMDVIINGGEIPTDKTLDLLVYLWVHVAPLDVVVDAVLKYHDTPDVLKTKVLMWSATLTEQMFSDLIRDLVLDKETIENNQFEIVPDDDPKGVKKKSLIRRVLDSLFGWLPIWQRTQDGVQKQSR